MATRFITVSIEIMHDKKLNQSQKFILSEIEQLSSLKDGCYASNSHFSELIGITKENVSRNINSLQKMGYIEIETKDGSRNYERLITITKIVTPPYHNSNPPLSKQQETKENIHNNIYTYEEFHKKFPFINVEHFNKLVQHLENKYPKLTKTRITSNIKKMENNKDLFAVAVDKMIELNYNGLFVPNVEVKDKDWRSLPNSEIFVMLNGKRKSLDNLTTQDMNIIEFMGGVEKCLCN